MDIIGFQVNNVRSRLIIKCIEVSLSNPDAVICMNSALYYQGVLSAEPDYLSVATERTDRSMMKMDFMIQRHYFFK